MAGALDRAFNDSVKDEKLGMVLYKHKCSVRVGVYIDNITDLI